MGKKAKGSRKGKKAWRDNISTEDIEDFFEKSTKDALSGGSLNAVPSENIFCVDKSKGLAVKKKIEKHREKVLRVDSLLQKNEFVQPGPSSTLKKSTKKHKDISATKDAAQVGPKDDATSTSGMFDLWGNKGEDNSKVKKVLKPSLIPAVEVDPPGCSFNPSFESHQDSLACAVAQEMQKVLKNELGPESVPLIVPGEAIAEEDMYFLDVDDGSDGDETNRFRSKDKFCAHHDEVGHNISECYSQKHPQKNVENVDTLAMRSQRTLSQVDSSESKENFKKKKEKLLSESSSIDGDTTNRSQQSVSLPSNLHIFAKSVGRKKKGRVFGRDSLGRVFRFAHSSVLSQPPPHEDYEAIRAQVHELNASLQDEIREKEELKAQLEETNKNVQALMQHLGFLGSSSQVQPPTQLTGDSETSNDEDGDGKDV